MTTNLLAFNVVATAYLVVGSLHEEARLKEAYGERYEAYRNSGVAYYLPLPDRSAFEAMDAVAGLKSDDEVPKVLPHR